MREITKIFKQVDDILNKGLDSEELNTLWNRMNNPHLRFALKQIEIKQKLREGIEGINKEYEDREVDKFLEELEEFEGMEF